MSTSDEGKDADVCDADDANAPCKTNGSCGTLTMTTTTINPSIVVARPPIDLVLVVSQNLMAAANSLSLVRPSASTTECECEDLTCTEEKVLAANLNSRTHVVIELLNNETSYVESLEDIVQKYLRPLRSVEYANLVDKQTVDEIFYMIPALLRLHERFLDDLQNRLNSWDDAQSQIGVAFSEAFSDSGVFDTYMTFLNNLPRATSRLRTARLQRPNFNKFLDATARKHKGKLSLDSLLIKPVQKFPSYQLILMRLIQLTADDHPDVNELHKAVNLVHDMLVTLNCKKREEFERSERETTMREIESCIEGVSDLVTPDRQFLLFDMVNIVPTSHSGRKERGIFLFNDLLIVCSVKRRSGTVRKPITYSVQNLALMLETNKYKLIMKIPIDDLDIIKIKDEHLQKLEREIDFLSNDLKKLHQIADVANTLRCPHQSLDEGIKELTRDLQRQLTDRQTNDPQLSILDLSLHSSSELLSWSIMFGKANRKTLWEQALLELKQKIAASLQSPPAPEYLMSIPIRKTRAGLQFTCAAPTPCSAAAPSDVWVCNSDGYVGQVCVLSLAPEPSVMSCNSVCNARILCLQSVPPHDGDGQPQQQQHPAVQAKQPVDDPKVSGGSKSLPNLSNSMDENDVTTATAAAAAAVAVANDCRATVAASHATAASESADKDSAGNLLLHHHQQSTMWLGMEDGYVHVYNCSDNIRIKNTKIKIQHGSAVTDILYMDNQIFVSLANGDICVYTRINDVWQTNQPRCLTVGTVSHPVTQMLRVQQMLWCSTHGSVKLLDALKYTIDYELRVSDKPITNMVLCGDKVWLSIKNTASVECYHGINFNLLHKVNLALQVTKMLFGCDEIIRQHKAACLRVTSMLSCKNLIWIGTSAGVVLTVRTVEQTTAGLAELPIVTGLPHGHTGHVRVLTCVEYDGRTEFANKELASKLAASDKTQQEPDEGPHLLVISGGDGYENFRPNSTAAALNDSAGREDSTNHLLIWQA